jgi:hypothetical protein
MFKEFAKEDHIFFDELKIAMIDYIPIDDRVIPSVIVIPQISEDIVPSDLAAFFDEFDIDGNGELDLGESQDFFYWVEDNVVYRFDDENQQNPGGFPVGDGRPGPEYWQTPYETWVEKAGDCEDMAII